MTMPQLNSDPILQTHFDNASFDNTMGDEAMGKSGDVNAETVSWCGISQRRSERPSTRAAPGSSNEISLALAVAKQRLADLQRENETLKRCNERLTSALAEASKRGTEAHRLARHDPLTGLPNRLSLMERLEMAIAVANKQQRQLALLFIDLDGFKVVNDCHGHTTGDKLLTAAAARIAAGIRSNDIAYRYGGDEFVVLLSNVHDKSTAIGKAEEIRAHIGQRYAIDGKELRVTASVGVALYPSDGERSDALLRHADASMYRSKYSRG